MYKLLYSIENNNLSFLYMSFKMQTSPHILINKVELFDDKLIFSYVNEWFQEDIENLYEHLFSIITQVSIQEVVRGADRESIRFTWQSCHYFTLLFDYYSQSCWIEGEDQQSRAEISRLYQIFEGVN